MTEKKHKLTQKISKSENDGKLEECLDFIKQLLPKVAKKIISINPVFAFAIEGLSIEVKETLWANMVYDADSDTIQASVEACSPSGVMAEVFGKERFLKEISRLLCHELGHRVWEKLPEEEKQQFFTLVSEGYRGSNYANSYKNEERRIIEKFADAFAGSCYGRERGEAYQLLRSMSF